MLSTNPCTASIALLNAFGIVSVKNKTIVSIALDNNSGICPNKSDNVSKKFWNPSAAFSNPSLFSISAPISPITPRMLLPRFANVSTIPETTPFTPSPNCSQFPVNNPMKMSITDSIWLNTPSKTIAIVLKAPSNTGARTSHKANQTVLITSVMFSKSKPSALILSTTPPKKLLIDSFMLFQIPTMLSLNSSFVFHNVTNAPTKTTTTAITAAIGANIPPNPVEIPAISFGIPPICVASPAYPAFTKSILVLIVVIVVPNNLNAFTTVETTEITFARINNTGPIAASINPNLTIWSCSSSDKLLNFSTSPVIHSANCLIYGVSFSPIRIPADSNAPFNCSTAPAVLSIITDAMSSAAPFALFISSVNFWKSSSEALTIANNPDIPSCPANIAAYCAFCSSVNPANFSLNSTIVWLNGFIVPSVFVILILSSSTASFASPTGFANLVMVERNAVPA